MENLLEQLTKRVEDFQANINTYIREELMRYSDDIIRMLHAQLFAGQKADGSNLRPYYSEDPWFNSSQRAQNYARWKERITPHASRHWDVPNLYIDGTFYSEIGLTLDYAELFFYGVTSYAQEIMNKYGQDSFDLNSTNSEILGQMILPALQERFNQITNLQNG